MTSQHSPELLTSAAMAGDDVDAPPAAGPLASVSSSLLVIALGTVAAGMSVALGLGTPAAPEPGLWPFLISGALVLLGIAELFFARRRRDAERFTRLSLRPVIGVATLAAMVALMPLVGFELPALALSVVWMRLLGGESWRSALTVSALVVVGFYAIFVLALNVTVPHLF